MRKAVPVVLGLVLAVVVLPFLPASPAGATPPPPDLVAPVDAAVLNGVNPVFQWNAAPGAVRYTVQLSTSFSMSSIISGGTLNTTNLKATYTQDLPASTLYWRVAAYDVPSGGTPAYSEVRSFTKTSIARPNPLSPGPGFTFTFPTDAPTFSWSAVQGAKSYDIQIDNDSGFTAPLLVSDSTKNTSFTLEDPQPIGQTFWWRVRAKGANSVTSDFSDPQSYSFSWPVTPTPISPGVAASSIPPNTLPKVEQVDFSWTPITGAAGYDLQYDNNSQFSAPTTVRVKSSKYSPPTTLNNGSYFWRVRGVTETNGVGAFGDVFTFERAWPAANTTPAELGAISLVAPVDNSLTVREPNFTWTPQRLGSRYQIQISPDANFSANVLTATTTATSYTPYPNTWNPSPGTTYYWRVRALDDPLPVNGRYTDQGTPAWKFIYFPEIVTQTAPAEGASSIAPRLEWSRPSSPLIGQYRVKIYDKNMNVVRQADTYNNYYFPSGLDAAKNPHYWKVITKDNDGRYGPEPDSVRSFNILVPTAGQLTPSPERTSPNNATDTHVPPLTWSPVTTDGTYTVKYATHGSNIYTVMADELTVPGYAHNTDSIPPGSYDWWVEAYTKDGAFISAGALSQFNVVELPKTTLTAPAHCPPNAACTKLYSTPTMDWNPVEGATHYKVTVALDENFTNVFAQYDTQYTQLTPRDSYPDNQAGQAYYWYARPCYGDICGKQPANFAGDPATPVRAFQKIAKPVPQSGPAGGATVTTNQVTFSWGGFLQTNQTGPVAERVTQEARSYIVEVSARADFATKVDTSPKVDQTTYTAFSKTYPEGPLYWRVIIVDGSQNILTAPAPTTFTKDSPLVAMATPAANQVVSSAPVLTVTPKPFEVGYEFEIYKNPNEAISTTNRVFLAKVAVTATVPTIPLPAGQYGWRVRRYDADDLPGKWTAEDNSQLRKFTVAGAAPNLLNPTNGANLDGNRLYFDWSTVNQAVSYKFETNSTSDFSAPNLETVTTVMNSWAPRAAYADGSYFWRVSTLDTDGNVIGTSTVRSFSVGVAGSKYVSITPVRILDSRTSPQWTSPSTPGAIGPGSAKVLKVAGGSTPTPADATAVVLNVTAVEGSSQSFLTLYPNGTSRPTASNLNFLAGQIVPNLVTVKVGTNGNVDVFNAAGNINVVADIVGYYSKTSGDRYNSVTPVRILDSRSTPQWSGNTGAIGGGQTRNVQVTGGTIPNDASAAIVNITAVESTAQSFLTAWPNGSPKPNASNLNFLSGQIVPNLALVKLGTGGQISIYNAQGSVNVVIDIVGYFKGSAGSFFHELDPSRILDTRNGTGLSGKFNAGQDRDLQVSGNGGVPAGAAAVVMNLTAVEGTAQSFLTIYPDGVAQPNSSNVNFLAGQIIPNLTTVGMSPGGKVTIFNAAGKVDVLGDVVGYYSAY